jgi:tetratricopeptide (TPR) repeat protein
MLETIREYGLDALVACGEENMVRRLHAAWCLALAEQAAPELLGPNQATWLARLDAEHANLRSALEWSLSTEPSPETPLRLGGALWRYWWSRGYARDALGWMTRALDKPWRDHPALRARALRAAAGLAEAQADYQRAQAWYDEALTIARSIGDESGEAAGLNGLGWILRSQGALDRAEVLHERALAIFRRLGDRRGAASALNNLGAIAFVRGAADDAAHYWSECLAAMRVIGDDRSVSAALGNLGILAVMQGDAERAIALHEESLAIARSLGDREGADHALANLGRALYEHGDQSTAVTAYEEALRGCRQSGDTAGEADILHNLGEMARARDDLPLAAARLAESLRLFHATKSLPGLASVLEQIGAVAAKRDASHEAVRLWAAADAIRRETGAAPEHGEQECRVIDARAGLGDAAFEAAWASGSGLMVEDAVAEALEYATVCAVRQ